MRRTLWMIALAANLSACATPGGRNTAAETIRHEMDTAAQEGTQPIKPETVNNALLPPLTLTMPQVDSKPLEARFDLAVNSTPANQVFNAIVSGTRYSMLVPPDVNGDISLNLKDVTVFDALEAIREMYGYEYKVDGARIYIQPASLQTRIFQVNYLTGVRAGTSSVRVSSNALADASSGTGGNSSQGTTIVGDSGDNKDGSKKSLKFDKGSDNSSKVTTTTTADFWDELRLSLNAIVGTDEKEAAPGEKKSGRSVVISPMSGVIVIRAMPSELRDVAAYLKASQISIERQVILEAKIVEVQLSDSFQSGVNWGGFGNLKSSPTSRGSFGVLSPGASLAPNAAGEVAQNISSSLLTATPATDLISLANSSAGTMFGLAFQTNNFAALLNFLESQGNVHVLSSPRIATLNNQKAVLKVGTDEFFVTEITGGTAATVNVPGTAPTVKVTPFFTGIALDVTPRIDENNEIILHVHPSVSAVSTVNKTLNLGASGGSYNLPLASSSISETDSIVRARDGQIVAIGGLMRQATFDDQSGLPGMSKTLFGQTEKRTEKRELIILIKPTVVDADRDWSEDITRSRDRMNGMTR